jgi:branched-chain amino acid transport system permease protein
MPVSTRAARTPTGSVLVIAVIVAGLLALQRVLWPAPLGVLAHGALIGGLTGLVALGIALVYRANGIVNFAQGDLGALPATFAVLLIIGTGLNYFLALALGMTAAVALGMAVELAVVRRFFTAPRLILTVATIGLAQVLAASGVLLPRAFDLDKPAQSYPSPFDVSFSISPIEFGGNDVMAMIAIVIVLFTLAGFLKVAKVGIAIRASAENAGRAASLGIPVKRLHTAVWALAAVLSTIALFLRAGVVGLPIGTVLSPGILLRALAAVVIGRMERLGLIMAAAIGLGVIENAVIWDTGRSVYVDPILFVVVVAALLAQRRQSRRELESTTSWVAVADVRRLPQDVLGSPRLRWARRFLVAAALAAALVAPHLLSESRVNLAAAVLIFAVIGLSLVVLTGWAGHVSLGQMAFVGIGAALAGAMTDRAGWDLALALPIATAAGGAIALVIGIPALRVRGLQLAVTTLAFALAVSNYGLNRSIFDWLPDGRIDREPLLGGIGIDTEARFYYVALAGLALALAAVVGMRRSRTGRVLRAVRENESAAQAFGVDATRTTLTAFAISGALAAYAGALFVHHQQSLGRGAYAPEESLEMFTMVVIGGLGSIPGALLGAAYVRGIDWFLDPDYRFLATGAGLLLVLMVLPRGLGGTLSWWRDRVALRLSPRRDRPASSVGPRRDSPLPHAPGTSRGLVVRGLGAAYDGGPVLFGIDLDVGPAGVVAVLGTNGSGKSTLLATIGGLLPASGGRVVFDGEDITGEPAHRVARRGVAHVPGGRAIFPSLTVAEHLRLTGWGRRHTDDADVARQAAERFPVLIERWDDAAGRLSGGEQQMLAFAMALAAQPSLLLVDELSLGLAPTVIDQLLETIRELQANGTTVVVVEQSLIVAAAVADEAYFLEKGEVRFHGPTADLVERPDLARSVFLRASTSEPAPARAAGRRELTSAQPVVLEAANVTRRFGGLTAVDDVSMTIAKGEIVGVIGPNGAGKTTLFDVISGFLEADSGSILVNGADVTARRPDVRARLGLARSFQNSGLFPALTVRDSIAVGLDRHVEVHDPIAAALWLPVVARSETRVTARTEELLQATQLAGDADLFVRELSTGMRKVLELACVLAHQPDVVLLDEPSAGLSQGEAEALVPLLIRLRDATGASIVLIDHDVALVSSVADRILVMIAGRVVAEGSAHDVLSNPEVLSAYLGESSTAPDPRV